jgi:hypothetical protein
MRSADPTSRAHPVYLARIGAAEMSPMLDLQLADQFRDHFHVMGAQLGTFVVTT